MRGTQAKRLRAQARKLCNPKARGYIKKPVQVRRRSGVVDLEAIVLCAPGGFRATYQKLKREFQR